MDKNAGQERGAGLLRVGAGRRDWLRARSDAAARVGADGADAAGGSVGVAGRGPRRRSADRERPGGVGGADGASGPAATGRTAADHVELDAEVSAMKDTGFLIRGRELRRALDDLVAVMQERHPGRTITREGIAREILTMGVERATKRVRVRPYRED